MQKRNTLSRFETTLYCLNRTSLASHMPLKVMKSILMLYVAICSISHYYTSLVYSHLAYGLTISNQAGTTSDLESTYGSCSGPEFFLELIVIMAYATLLFMLIYPLETGCIPSCLIKECYDKL